MRISEIYEHFRGEYWCYTENIEAARKIIRWESVERSATHIYSDGKLKAFEFIFPTRTYDRVAEALGLPPRKKSPGRVKQGQRLQKVDRIAEVKSSFLTSTAV